MSRDEGFEGDGQATPKHASFERLEARWRDPRQLPAREPSPQLLASVRRDAHLQLVTGASAEPPAPTARAGGGRREASIWALTAAMVAVVVGYVGWAVAFTSQLYR